MFYQIAVISPNCGCSLVVIGGVSADVMCCDIGFSRISIHVWRCPLHGSKTTKSLLSKVDFEQFSSSRQRGVENGKRVEWALYVEILHHEGTLDHNNASTITKVTDLFFPSFEPNIGIHQVLQSKPSNNTAASSLPMLQKRHNMTLCLTVFENGIVYLPEHIHYHLNVLGIDHVHLGLQLQKNGGAGQNSEQSKLGRIVHRMFQSEIDA